jgi:hypothetical protein
MDIHAAPSEGNQRARVGSPGGPAPRAHDSGRDGGTRAEDLGVDTAGSDAPGCYVGGQFTHEGGWPADVEIGIARYFKFAQRPNVQKSGTVEIYPGLSSGPGEVLRM